MLTSFCKFYVLVSYILCQIFSGIFQPIECNCFFTWIQNIFLFCIWHFPCYAQHGWFFNSSWRSIDQCAAASCRLCSHDHHLVDEFPDCNAELLLWTYMFSYELQETVRMQFFSIIILTDGRFQTFLPRLRDYLLRRYFVHENGRYFISRVILMENYHNQPHFPTQLP